MDPPLSTKLSSGGVQEIIPSRECSAPSIEELAAATNSIVKFVGGGTLRAAPEN